MMRRWVGWPRLLPLAIVAMVLLTLVKGAALVQGIAAPASAAEAKPEAAKHEAAKPEAAKHETSKPEVAKQEVAKQEGPPVEAPSPGPPPPSEAELALLQGLRARRTALDARAQAMDSREAVLAAAERRLSERVTEMAVMQSRLEALDSTRRERDEASWRGLVKTYETMRPRDAATIFNDLDQPVLIQVLDRMKESKAAPVLAAMAPERARLATTQLAQWRNRIPAAKQE